MRGFSCLIVGSTTAYKRDKSYSKNGSMAGLGNFVISDISSLVKRFDL